MRRLLVAALFLCLSPQWGAEAATAPALRGRVNDYAAMLSPGAAADLEEKLAAFERDQSTQIVVLTVPSLEGKDIESYGIAVAEAWKIGQRGKDNGAILIVAKAERALRLEVGRGLEESLTDVISGRIIDTVIIPHFKAGRFEQGIGDGVTAVMAAVRGEFSAAAPPPARSPSIRFSPPAFIFLIFTGVSLLRLLGKASPFLSAAAGAAALPIGVWLLLTRFGFLVLGILAAIGFILGFLLPRIPAAGPGRRPGGMWHSSGGSGWGGGFSGGGFSGGGGSFGGGGASGRW